MEKSLNLCDFCMKTRRMERESCVERKGRWVGAGQSQNYQIIKFTNQPSIIQHYQSKPNKTIKLNKNFWHIIPIIYFSNRYKVSKI